jgi:hypothetical protein
MTEPDMETLEIAFIVSVLLCLIVCTACVYRITGCLPTKMETNWRQCKNPECGMIYDSELSMAELNKNYCGAFCEERAVDLLCQKIERIEA